MTWFVSGDTYRVTVSDPDGNEGWVELRPLNAGDKADIDDSVSIDESSNPSVKLGTYRRLMVEKALQAWSFELAVTPHTISKLHTSVFDQIAEEVSFGSPLGEETENEDESN